ncbi:(2Fe-2S)-binding protein [Marinobacter sp. R17]
MLGLNLITVIKSIDLQGHILRFRLPWKSKCKTCPRFFGYK